MNDGQPVPDLNFASELNSSSPQHTQVYTPLLLLSQYSPLNARSVPFSRVTWYCIGVSSWFAIVVHPVSMMSGMMSKRIGL